MVNKGYTVGTKWQFYGRLDPLSFYTDKKFTARYRLSKTVVRVLIKNFVAEMPPRRRVVRGRHAVSHRLRFCAALRYFATGANYLAIADCHGLSKSTVSRCVKDVSDFFHRNLADYVHWPNSETEKNNKAVVFYREKKFPGPFGMIDGTHIPIHCPRGLTSDENQYFCYKGYYSINTMIICDWDSVIFHVNAANPGSCNDIYCLNGSQVKFLGERGDFNGFFLLGDSGYVLTDYLIPPVKYEETNADVRFNKWHKRTRSKVERTIGQLKQRWRCLDSSGGYLHHEPHRAGCIIESCVALHNCAKVGQVKLLRDFPAQDGFHRIQNKVVQPDNVGRKPRQKFHNLRETYINQFFTTAAERAALHNRQY